MQSYRRFLFITIWVALTAALLITSLSGCFNKNSSNNTAHAIEAVIAENYISTVLDIETGLPGSASFQMDAAISSTVDFTGDGSEKVVELTDRTGLTWRLVIPANALIRPSQITITALSDVSSDYFGNMKGGICLEPDGLQFIVPAELTVTGPGLEKNGLIVSGSKDGSELDYAFMLSNKGQVAANITHFSNAYVDTPSEDESKQLIKDVLKRCKNAEKAAKELIKKSLQVPPPPRIPMPECMEEFDTNEEIQETIKRYVDMFKEPEKKVFDELMAANRAYQLLTGEVYDKNHNTAQQILNRWKKKADILIQQYKPQEEYFAPVLSATLMIESSINMLSPDLGTTEYISVCSEWAEELRKKFLREIRDEHKYRRACSFLYMDRVYSFLTGNSDVQNSLRELGDALTFKIIIEEEADIAGVVPGGDLARFFFGLEGKVEGVSLVDPEAVKQIFHGSGTVEYMDVKIPSKNDSFQYPNSFAVNAWVAKFKPCKSDEISILVDAFGAKTEPRVSNGQRMEYPGVVQNVTAGAFKDRALSDENLLEAIGSDKTLYEFPMTLQNGQEYAANEIFHGSYVFGSHIKYTLKLIHTPK